MQILYNLAAILVVILIIPVFMIRSVREKGFVERIRQSLGIFPEHTLDKVAKKHCIWVHAASVGEIVATSPLIKEFHREFPQTPILVSVVTTSGYEMANRIIKDADAIIYFPLDLPILSGRVLRRIHPRVFLPVETELWPNFLKTARQLHIPVMMVNGRISDRSVKQYKYLNSLLTDMIGTVTKFAMQSDIDADYIKRLGAPPELVTVTGNTKFDQTYTDVSLEEKAAIMREMGLEKAEGILLAGSTHRGEEDFVLKAFKAVRENHAKAKLVIAPRELLRTQEVIHLCKRAGFTVTTRTKQQEHGPQDADIVILDTIGELGKVYSVGDVVYVGGSLIPHGGHNILEPAAHGKAIIVGHYMFNFKDTHALFKKRDACITVNNEQELAQETVKLFDDADHRHRLERETLAIVGENKGASRKSALILRETLENYESKPENRQRARSTQKIDNFQTYFIDLVHQKEVEGFGMHILTAILYVFSKIYACLVDIKLWGYRHGVFSRKQLGCFVISLGNVTVGGTGKTPTAQRLASDIRDMGYKVVILNRGYRAKWHGNVGIVSDGERLHMTAADAGDEAFMLAKHLPEVPVLIGADRSVTGQYAIENFGAEVAILDDGFQHWQLERDMDILLVDAVNVFGNGYMLPRGTLREPISHISRADVCLMTKVDQAADGSREYIRDTVHRYNESAQIVESIHAPRRFIPLADWYVDIAGDGIDVNQMRGKKIMAVSAIGNPASFEQTLSDLGVVILESLRYPDHHDYSMQEMADILHQAQRMGAEAIVITEKDAVKIPMEVIHAGISVPVYVICVEVNFQQGKEEFQQLLAQRLESKLGRRAER
ncbi:putative 3-deoxy-D-manno-octulosonic-acid (KDO) transferase/tetraacyldisaccharide-1-P 4'-kinase [Selenomonas ruminantium subsp. lactilytica TAM6421]|uniref:Tetraacyldisaccharide 4'-kinase n=1 Tax=Selenomonas ruminantium subsp. lactilytica (strain NBRC 103574 / TAM6421) TaxID=927704 RepID=I0GU64_SELRL|nr:tetraacyldisaccharide 4'-kinase [Selenomonas ruminantium]BAL84301.1 putative 3-deoxy-D-manno-octulosonic-acid (KDO) transferase/tetraacyldisaccharide-1-P 4'-kinase [Selenomonas ruminantium subsp. lactilytica TAM6421]